MYINNGQKNNNKGGWKWKFFLFMSFFLMIIGAGLKIAAPTIVEKWINRMGADSTGYAFSVRDVELSFGKGQLVLNDVKVFNHKTSVDLIEVPKLTVKVNWEDLVMNQNRILALEADQIDVLLSRDFSSELERIKGLSENEKNDLYLNSIVGIVGKLNIIEQKEDQSRTVIELNNVNVKVKDVSLMTINKKSEFRISSKIADGGKLNLTGKTIEEDGRTPWTVQGSLQQVPASFFNKIAGDKLPFAFNESKLNAEIVARSFKGELNGEITPDIKRLNLIQEKPGIPTQSIARVLTDELTFTLPFTLKDELTLQYEDTYKKLRTYRKYAATSNEMN